MKEKRRRALETFLETRRAYDALHAINPRHELLRYTRPEGEGLLVNEEEVERFNLLFAPDRHLPLAQYMQARWHGYKVALEKAIEESPKPN